MKRKELTPESKVKDIIIKIQKEPKCFTSYLNPNTTLQDIYNSPFDFYELAGSTESEQRCFIFEVCCDVFGIEYDDIYNAWLDKMSVDDYIDYKYLSKEEKIEKLNQEYINFISSNKEAKDFIDQFNDYIDNIYLNPSEKEIYYIHSVKERLFINSVKESNIVIPQKYYKCIFKDTIEYMFRKILNDIKIKKDAE